MTTLWSRLDEDVFEEVEVTLDGKTQKIMKTDINIKFEGTYTEFVEWMAETFKDPASLYLRVGVGSKETVTAKTPSTEPESGLPLSVKNAYVTLAGESWHGLSQIALENRENQLVTLCKVREKGNKIETIKLVRQYTNCGLKEAKDFVEQHFR